MPSWGQQREYTLPANVYGGLIQHPPTSADSTNRTWPTVNVHTAKQRPPSGGSLRKWTKILLGTRKTLENPYGVWSPRLKQSLAPDYWCTIIETKQRSVLRETSSSNHPHFSSRVRTQDGHFSWYNTKINNKTIEWYTVKQ